MKRDDRLDVLRGIGLLCIVLAHVGPPEFLFQIRNFDVPLMVLVAGSSFAISTQTRPKTGYIEYLKRRFIRLVIPTWIFLSILFTVALIASIVMHKTYPFSLETIISSFLLLNGIGYVWIIRVFLLVSFIAPLTRFCSASTDNAITKNFIALLAVYAMYEISVRFIPLTDQVVLKVIINDVLYMILPYGCIFFFGAILYTISGKKMLTSSMIFLFLFSVYALFLYERNGHFISTQYYKYPPTAYYFLYAMFTSISLYWLVQTDIYSRIPGKNCAAFLGRSSMWIYLWHILILYVISWLHISINFAFSYIIVLGTSVGIVILQMIILKKVLASINSQRKIKLLNAAFSG